MKYYDEGLWSLEISITVVMSFRKRIIKKKLKSTDNIIRGIIEHPVVDKSLGKWNISLFCLCIVIFTLYANYGGSSLLAKAQLKLLPLTFYSFKVSW